MKQTDAVTRFLKPSHLDYPIMCSRDVAQAISRVGCSAKKSKTSFRDLIRVVKSSS